MNVKEIHCDECGSSNLVPITERDALDTSDKYSFSQRFLTAFLLKNEEQVIEIAREYVYKTLGRMM